MQFQRTYFAVSLLAAFCFTAQGREKIDIVVAERGGGDFTSIQEALNSIQSGAEPIVILIRNGMYNEKLWIRRSHVTLVGEDRDSTRIVYAELREKWNKEHNGSDWGSAVVNIDTNISDITLANLTIYNNHGSLYGTYNKHAFTIRGRGTRIMLLHCSVISDGGDALSLWNKNDGMYYHNDCYFEGWVDYVCPRGWCYITDSRFFGHNMSASIWHDGDHDRRQKFVITNSFFDGVSEFPLGRNHRDGQFFLVKCRFSANMADRRIYHPPTSVTQWQWGPRHYYFDCHRDCGDYDWFRDNLTTAEGSPTPNEISAKWAFDGKWDPEGTMTPILPFASMPEPGNNAMNIREKVNLSWLKGRNADSHNLYIGKGDSLHLVKHLTDAAFEIGTLDPGTTYFWRVDEVTGKGIVQGKIWRFKTE